MYVYVYFTCVWKNVKSFFVYFIDISEYILTFLAVYLTTDLSYFLIEHGFTNIYFCVYVHFEKKNFPFVPLLVIFFYPFFLISWSNICRIIPCKKTKIYICIIWQLDAPLNPQLCEAWLQEQSPIGGDGVVEVDETEVPPRGYLDPGGQKIILN